ncbi:hypothetical protein ACFPRL_27510 [Pseudoclavibacter helvolus]
MPRTWRARCLELFQLLDCRRDASKRGSHAFTSPPSRVTSRSTTPVRNFAFGTRPRIGRSSASGTFTSRKRVARSK